MFFSAFERGMNKAKWHACPWTTLKYKSSAEHLSCLCIWSFLPLSSIQLTTGCWKVLSAISLPVITTVAPSSDPGSAAEPGATFPFQNAGCLAPTAFGRRFTVMFLLFGSSEWQGRLEKRRVTIRQRLHILNLRCCESERHDPSNRRRIHTGTVFTELKRLYHMVVFLVLLSSACCVTVPHLPVDCFVCINELRLRFSPCDHMLAQGPTAITTQAIRFVRLLIKLMRL